MTILVVICKTVDMQNNSQWPCSMCPIPQPDLWGWGYSIFLDIPSSRPRYKSPLWGEAWCTPLHLGFPGCPLASWLAWELKLLSFPVNAWTYIKPLDNSLIASWTKERMFMYPDYLTSTTQTTSHLGFPSQTNPNAKNAGLILLNIPFCCKNS